MNGQAIQTLEELKANFHLQDALRLYRNGVLLRWLEAHGWDEKRDELAAFPAELDDADTAETLIRLFCPDFAEDSVRDALYILDAEKNHRHELEKYRNLEGKRTIFLEDYHSGYTKLKEEIRVHAFDFSFLSLAAISLVDRYWELVLLEQHEFCIKMFKESPGIFFPLLALDKFPQGLRNNICVMLKKHIDNCISGASSTKFKKNINNCILGASSTNLEIDSNSSIEKEIQFYLLRGDDNKEISFDEAMKTKSIEFNLLHTLWRTTHESWDDLIPDTGRRMMVIRLGEKNFVRGHGTRVEIDASQANTTFPILDGLDYKGLDKEILAFMDVTDIVQYERNHHE